MTPKSEIEHSVIPESKFLAFPVAAGHGLVDQPVIYLVVSHDDLNAIGESHFDAIKDAVKNVVASKSKHRSQRQSL